MRSWLSNLGAGVLALLLAAVVWIVAVREEYPRAQFDQPISVNRTGLADEYTLFGDMLSEVRIEIRAPKTRWPNLQARDFNAWVDLAGYEAGEYDVPVHVRAPDPQVQVLAVDPPAVRVRIEARSEKSLPVQVNIMDATAFGYSWQSPVVTPTHVLVSGSAPLVDQVTVVSVDMYLRGARAPVERSLRVSARNSAGESVGFVTVAPRDVSVTVPVVQLPGYREIAILVEPVGEPATGYTVSAVSADPKLVTVQGEPSVIAQLSGYITVPVSIADASQDVLQQVALRLPENVSALGAQTVRARVSVVPIIGVQTVRTRPVIQGLGAGLVYTLTLDSVSVFLSGPVPSLLTLAADAVPVVLDLTGLGPGLHILEPQVVAPENIEVKGLSPQTIEVTIALLPSPTAPSPTAEPSPTPPVPQNPALTPTPTPTRRSE